MKNPSAMTFRQLSAALGAFAAVLVATACASSTQTAAKAERLCTPDAWVYCRCQSRDEGSKQCNEDGTKFGPCMPCETTDNPVIEDPPPEPFDPFDGGPGTAASCGDKIVQDGEACDDGNTDDADGCDAKCKLAGTNPASSRGCPGMPVHVWGPAVTYTGTTVGAPNQFETPTCPSAQGNVPTRGAAAPERVFSVTVHKSGVLLVKTSNASFNTYLFAQQPCKVGTPSAQAPWLACSNKNDNTTGESLELPVQSGQTYAIVVDGANIDAVQGGTFTVSFEMSSVL